jgi:hypothetical protein
MKMSRKLRRAALLVLAAASAWRYIGRRRTRRANSGSEARHTIGHPWPDQVKNFVSLLRQRGATVRDVRIERAGGKHTWVVEWNGGRTLTFPDRSAEFKG